MEAKDVEKKLDAADSILTKLKVLLKKHWGILLFLLVCYFVYWAFTLPAPAPVEETYQELYVDTLAEPVEEYSDDTTSYENEPE